MAKSVERITTYYELGRTFFIIKDERGFWGIEDKDFDESGRLIKQINGLLGHFSKDISLCIKSVSFQIRYEDKKTHGMTSEQAIRATAMEDLER